MPNFEEIESQLFTAFCHPSDVVYLVLLEGRELRVLLLLLGGVALPGLRDRRPELGALPVEMTCFGTMGAVSRLFLVSE